MTTNHHIATRVKAGDEIVPGDIVVFMGTVHLIDQVEKYTRFGACGIAKDADGWGITLFPHVAVQVA